jgi:phage terminase large subunit-like protein
VSNLTKSLLTSDCIRQEAVLEAAVFHVKKSREMQGMVQGMVQYKTREAIESLIALKRHATRDRVLVCDYAHNINYPHYSGEQPGEIYYLSALILNLFGIVDLSVTPKSLIVMHTMSRRPRRAARMWHQR